MQSTITISTSLYDHPESTMPVTWDELSAAADHEGDWSWTGALRAAVRRTWHLLGLAPPSAGPVVWLAGPLTEATARVAMLAFGEGAQHTLDSVREVQSPQ